ncbi:IS1595 family transposase [Rhodoferax sp. TS-BS-61-7]|uniref:IS1595 family transposase n=1 Tax=Rhodoferax sp. TS-BS-61-7 TaxID=2094194 RepID=UPI000CF64F68|nr:IS1595 family transposase [Rhodoferax sp. TS-BS-61-7]PQA78064.1 hypothetical protein C5F53_06940 [Rhodoferax sp. TS-BS-61-7]
MTETTSTEATATPDGKRKLFPLRKRTGTASFHMSKAAVGFGADDLENLSPKEAIMLTAGAVWGSTEVMPCPHCGTIDSHLWRPLDLRWKCKGCGSTFSVTSKTVFADLKLPLSKVLKIAHSWMPGSSGVPALQLRRHWGMTYPTIFTLCHKLREGIARGFNVGVLAGYQEMDGMDTNGRRYREKRNKPLGSRHKGAPTVPVELLKPDKDFVGPPVPHKFWKKVQQPADRRMVMVMRQRGVSKGKGATATRVGIAITESSHTATTLATRFASAESVVLSDEDGSYDAFGRIFKEHKSISHSEAYSDGKGTNNNQAESFNRRMRRAVEGMYLNPSNKYLHEYASEQAWREDTRRMPTGEKLHNLLRVVMFVGPSQSWCGYTQGKHRLEELLLEGNKPAKARGRPKGWVAPVPR